MGIRNLKAQQRDKPAGGGLIGWVDVVNSRELRGWLIDTRGEFTEVPAISVNGLQTGTRFYAGGRPDVGVSLGVSHSGGGWSTPLSGIGIADRLLIRARYRGEDLVIFDGTVAELVTQLMVAFWKSNSIAINSLALNVQSRLRQGGITNSAHFNEPITGRTTETLFTDGPPLDLRPDFHLSRFQTHIYYRHCREHPGFRKDRHRSLSTFDDVVSFLDWSLRSFGVGGARSGLAAGPADLRFMNREVPGTGLVRRGGQDDRPLFENASVVGGVEGTLPLTCAQRGLALTHAGSDKFTSPEEMADFLLSWLGSWGEYHRGWVLLTNRQQQFLRRLSPASSDLVPVSTWMVTYGALARLRESREYDVYREALQEPHVHLAFMVHLALNEAAYAGSTVLVEPFLEWVVGVAASAQIEEFSVVAAALESLVHWSPPDRSPVEPGVAVLGMLESKSGLGTNARNSVKAFQRIGQLPKTASISLHDRSATTTSLSPSAMACETKLIHVNPDNLPELIIAAGATEFDKSYNIGFFAWELDKHPRAHLLALSLVDEIWVPSEFCAASFRPYTTKPIQVMPHCVDIEAATISLNRADLGLQESDFVVHVAFDLHSWPQRKNPIAAISAFLRAFPNDSSAKLLLKIRNGHNIGTVDSDRDGIGPAIVELAERDSRILLDFSERSYPETQVLLALADCHLSLHRSEGFGYGLAEALLLGVPVITSDYSASTEFCRQENSWLVPCQSRYLQEGEYYLAPGGARWGEPDVDAAARLLSLVRSSPDVVREKVQEGRRFARGHLSLDVMAARYGQRLQEIANAVVGDGMNAMGVERSEVMVP